MGEVNSTFDTISNIIIIVTVIVAVVFVAYMVYAIFFRKKMAEKQEQKSEESLNKGKIFSSADFIPVESIENGVLKVEGEDRYVASINCKGFDFFTATTEEQYTTEANYIAFLNTVQSPMTMRIDSSAVDLSAQIARFRTLRSETMEVLQQVYGEFLEARNAYKDATDEEKPYLEDNLYNLNRKVVVYQNKLAHIENLIEYEEEMSGRDAEPLQEERYIIDWTYNEKDFPASATEKDIRERAEKELANRVGQMKHALQSAYVKCTRDDDEAIFNLNFRHYHPYGGDMFRNFDETNADERVVSGKRGYEEMKRQYERFLLSEQWKKILEERMKGLEDAESDDYADDNESWEEL